MIRVQFYDNRPKEVWHKKRDEWLIVCPGRYGPAWVSRAVFWLARRLGMIRHQREGHLENIKTSVSIDTKGPLVGVMQNAVAEYQSRFGVRVEDIEVVCGESTYPELISTPLYESFGFGLQTVFNTLGESKILNIPIRVVPGLEGWAVLPLRTRPFNKISPQAPSVVTDRLGRR